MTYRCIGRDGNAVRKARTRGGIAVVVEDSELSRLGVEAASGIEADFDTQRYECTKCAVNSGSERDPFLRRFCGRVDG